MEKKIDIWHRSCKEWLVDMPQLSVPRENTIPRNNASLFSLPWIDPLYFMQVEIIAWYKSGTYSIPSLASIAELHISSNAVTNCLHNSKS